MRDTTTLISYICELVRDGKTQIPINELVISCNNL